MVRNMYKKWFNLILGLVVSVVTGTYCAGVFSQTGEKGCYFSSCEAGDQQPLIIKDKFCADIQISMLEAKNNFSGLYTESRKYTTEEFTGEKLEQKKGLGVIQRGFMEANYCDVSPSSIQCYYSKSYDPESSNKLRENLDFGRKMSNKVNECLSLLEVSPAPLEYTDSPERNDAFDRYICTPDGLKIEYLVYESDAILGVFHNQPDCANSNPFD